MNEDLNMISFQMIASAGDARAHAFEALEAAKAGDQKKCEELLKKAHSEVDAARRLQTDLLFGEMNGQQKTVNILLVHSQDHLMDAQLALDLIEPMCGMMQENQALATRVEALERKMAV